MSSLRIVLAVLCLILLTGTAIAQAPKVRIVAARVGLPPGNRAGATPVTASSPICKFGTWNPAYLELEVLEPVTGPAAILIESPDADGVATELKLPLDLSAARTGTRLTSHDLPLFPYVRPTGGEITISVRTADGAAISEPFRIRSLRLRDSLQYVVLSLGHDLPVLDLPVSAAAPEGRSPAGPLRGGRVELAAITDPADMPDQWFGYECADLVVLTTSSTDFLRRIFGDGADSRDLARREALLEWVRRGGRLVVTVGANADLIARQLPALQEILPYSINPADPARKMEVLSLFWSARTTSQASILSANLAAKGPFSVANLAPKPHRPSRIVIPPPARQSADTVPIAVQSGFGLGKITLIAFDLDQPPFTETGPQADLWDWVLREGGANRASIGAEDRPRPAGSAPTEEEDELAVALRNHIDTFDEVPVISFGWVAVLIFLYILLIGPVEYYFLRRVLRRPEWTWLTFPIIVLTVGLGIYQTADSLKGRELRLNKVDVVEVVADFDPATEKPRGRVYGRSWFTLFSPRIDTYTVGVRPAPEWTRSDTANSLVGWTGGLRGGQGSLLRRRYSYHVDPVKHLFADTLVDVPIPMWSTKSFCANWSADLDPASPGVESRLEHPPGEPSRAIGTFINRMPFPAIQDCVAFYAGQAYPIGTILHGQEVRLLLDQGSPATQLVQDRSRLNDILARVAPEQVSTAPGRPQGKVDSATAKDPLPLWGYMFHEAALRNEPGVIPRNASLRTLDQSWRLTSDNHSEVIVVGRVLAKIGPADSLFSGPDSASRLWLRGVPGTDAAPAISGYGRQETYIRLYLPIRPVEAKSS